MRMSNSPHLTRRREWPGGTYEILEIIYRWHRGDTHSAISRALGADRKTVRKYIGLALQANVERHRPLPTDDELAALLAPRLAALKVGYPTPALDRLVPYHDRLAAWANDPAVSIKQMWRLLGEAHPELNIGFTSLREYIGPSRPTPPSRSRSPPASRRRPTSALPAACSTRALGASARPGASS
jgi:hypothetical protein